MPTRFTRLFFDLRNLLSARKSAPHLLLDAVEQLSAAANAMLESATGSAQSQSQPNTRSKASHPQPVDITGVAAAIQRTYASMVQAMEKVSAQQNTPSLAGRIVFELVNLFQSLLGRLSALARRHAEEDLQSARANATRKTSRLRAAKRSLNSISTLNRGETYNSLARLVIHMVVSVSLQEKESLSSKPMADLLEGLLCSFLQYLGSALSLLVFNDMELDGQGSASLPEGVAGGCSAFTGLLPPFGLEEAGPSAADAKVALTATRIKAPYVILILENVIAFLDKHHPQSARVLTTSNSATGHTSTSAGVIGQTQAHAQGGNGQRTESERPLSQILRDRLQNTLLRGVFGDDSTFLTSLNLPAQAVTESPVAHGDGHSPAGETTEKTHHAEGDPLQKSDTNPSNHLIRETWRLLGWDILSHVIDNGKTGGSENE